MSDRAGYSLLELLLVWLLIAILAGLALPELGALLQRRQVQYGCQVLLHSAYYARSVAIQQGRSIWLCPSPDQQHCQAMPQWQQGWLVMTGSRAEQPPQVLRVQPALTGLSILSSQGRRRLRFQADGHAEGSNLSWIVCSTRHPGPPARVVVASSGRVRVEALAPGRSCPR